MKKSRDASDLAARIAAAASKPAGASFIPSPIAAPASAALPSASKAAPPTKPSKAKGTKPKEKELETVPITLRPSSTLLNKFVLRASERTLEEGRVVSAQQIMLETLERSDA
jgi:hypothetical protein